MKIVKYVTTNQKEIFISPPKVWNMNNGYKVYICKPCMTTMRVHIMTRLVLILIITYHLIIF